MSATNSTCRAALNSPAFHQNITTDGHKLRLLPATIEDTPEFVDLFFTIFKNELVFRAMYGTADWDLATARTIKQWADELRVEPAEARLRWYKVVNQDDKIVAISKWGFPHPPSSSDHSISPPMDEFSLIPGENKEVGDIWFSGLTLNRSKFHNPSTMYYMNTLAVLPEYQRMGLGLALMKSVLEVADKEGMGCYVEASSKGLGLYRKCGFKEAGRLEVDCAKFVEGGTEGETVFVTVPMVREARAGYL